MGLHSLFETTVAQRPTDKALVTADGVELTYAQLCMHSQFLAVTLRARLEQDPLPPDTLIGLHADRGAGMIIGILAIMQAGGAYVPLDPMYPAARLRWMAQGAGIAAVVSSDVTTASAIFELPDSRMIALDEQSEPTPVSLTPAGTRPTDLAYVLYTSGSSGKPKGVAVPHRGVCNAMLSLRDLLEIDLNDRVLQLGSINFDLSLAEIFPTLIAGAELDVADHAERNSMDALEVYLRSHGIQRALFASSVIAALPRIALPQLRSLMIVGETPSAKVMDFWSRGRKLFNGYGLTETSVASCAHEFQPGDPPQSHWACFTQYAALRTE